MTTRCREAALEREYRGEERPLIPGRKETEAGKELWNRQQRPLPERARDRSLDGTPPITLGGRREENPVEQEIAV